MFRKILGNEFVAASLFTAVVVGAIYGTLWKVQAGYVHDAREHAQALVGEHEIVNARYYLIGYVELYTAENETIQVPISNDYGMRVASWFWGDDSVRATPFRIRAAYSEQPVASSHGSETKNRDTMMAGTYLSITEVDPIATAQK